MKQVKMTVINKKEEVEEAKVIRVAAYCRVSTLNLRPSAEGNGCGGML